MYATQADITTIYSEDALYVADRDGDGVVDAPAVERALSSASDEIDSYLGTRYPLPITDPPGLLIQFCVDIAIYRLASSRDVLSEEHRRRYEDTLKHLALISSGKAVLVLPAVLGDDGITVLDRPKPIVVAGPPREFTRAKMRGF